MKKSLLTLVTTLFVTAAISQSIPNGGFENWTTVSFENPQNYMSSSGQQLRNSNIAGPVNVLKASDAYHGNYAVQLNTMLSGTDTAGAYLANGDPSKPAGQGIPYTENPNGLRFYYKSDVKPGDTALVIVMFKLNGLVIGSFTKKITGVQSTYALSTLGFNLPSPPDSIIFAVASSNLMVNNFRGIPGSMFQIDSVSFTGVTSQPSLFNGDFEVWQPQTVNSLTGWELSGTSGNNNGLNNRTTDASGGAYALELFTYLNNGAAKEENITSGHGTQTGTIGGHPYSLQVDTLDLYYKYAPGDPADSARVNLEFKSGGINFANKGTLLPASATYTHVIVPINLFSAPDSLIIFIGSSKTFNNPPLSYAGADLKIDNMSFRSQLVPASAFSISSPGCTGQAFQLNDLSTNIPTTWTWTASGGTLSNATSQNPTVTYTATGTYTVNLVAANSHGSGAIFSQAITINATPGMMINGASSICKGQSTILSGSGASIVSYSWSGGPSTQSYTVSPTSNKTYTLTGTDANGCTNIQTALLTVNPLPTLTVNSPTICAGSSSVIMASGAASYTWNTGATAASITVTPSGTTAYTVTGTSAANCANTTIATVTVNQLPSVTVNSGLVCAGNSIVLTASGATTYTWSANAGSATTNTVNVTPSSSSIEYTVTGSDINSCVNTATTSVTVVTNPTITVNNQSICLGQQTALLTANGASTYSWSPGFGLSSTSGASVSANPTVTTTYTVTGTAGTCSNTTSSTVTVNALPIPTATSNGPICANQTLNLFSSGGATYSWTGPNAFSSNQQNPSILNAAQSSSGTYTVIVTDANGCMNGDTITATVNGCMAVNNYSHNSISAFPNPSNGLITVVLKTANAVIDVYDMSGQKVSSQITNAATTQLDLRLLPDGIYFLEVKTTEGILHKKITKVN